MSMCCPHLRSPKLQEILSHAAKTPAVFLDLMSLGVKLRKNLPAAKISDKNKVTFPSKISDMDTPRYLKWWFGKDGKGDVLFKDNNVWYLCEKIGVVRFHSKGFRSSIFPLAL